MVQENRAFDNYFGVLAEYGVNHQPPIQGAQLSDVNDLHNLPPGYTIQNPQGQAFGPFHQRTECIENLSPSWDESHYDMDLVGDDWMNLTPNSQYLMDKFLWTTLSGGTGDQYDPTHSRPLGYYDQSDLPFYYELATQVGDSSGTHGNRGGSLDLIVVLIGGGRGVGGGVGDVIYRVSAALHRHHVSDALINADRNCVGGLPRQGRGAARLHGLRRSREGQSHGAGHGDVHLRRIRLSSSRTVGGDHEAYIGAQRTRRVGA